MKPNGCFVEINVRDIININDKFGNKISRSTAIELDHYLQSIEAAHFLNSFGEANTIYTKISVPSQFLVKLNVEIEIILGQ